MPPDIEINLGTQGSTIRDSEIEINEIGSRRSRPGSSLDAVIADFQELRMRLEKVESALTGFLGMPGITSQVADMQSSVRKIEQDLSVLRSTLERYDSMWQSIETSYRDKVPITTMVFYLVMLLLSIMTAYAIYTLVSGR